MNLIKKSQKLQTLEQKITKSLTKIYEISEFGAVQKNANLVDLEKYGKKK